MAKTSKLRKGPSDSATKFSIGTKKKGNDGHLWIIIATLSGTHRWKKFGETTKKHKITVKTAITNKNSTDVSVEFLNQLKKKYKVTTTGSKKDIAYGLWRVRGRAMESKDVSSIIHLLPKKEQKDIAKLLNSRDNNPITNYQGMWKSLPKPLGKMNRDELIKNLRLFRDAWEKITTRNQDLANERLANETTNYLRKLLKFYYSNDAKLLAEEWLRK